MRKIASSAKEASSEAFSARAEARSGPKGFSNTTRPCSFSPTPTTPWMTEFEQARWGGEVQQRTFRPVEHLAQPVERVSIAVVAAHIGQRRQQRLHSRWVTAAAVLGDRLPCVAPQLVVVPRRGRHTHDPLGKSSVPGDLGEGGKQLLLSRVSRRPEQDEGVAPVARIWIPEPSMSTVIR